MLGHQGKCFATLLLIPFVRIIDDSHQCTDKMHFHGLHSNGIVDPLSWIIKPKMSIVLENVQFPNQGFGG